MARRLPILIPLSLLVVADAGGKRPDATPQLDEERDALIAKLVEGKDVDASVKRFAELVRQRDAVVATSLAAREREQAAREREQAASRARSEYWDRLKKTIDYQIGGSCTLSVDPRHPGKRAQYASERIADWGKVVRKESIRLASESPLDEGEPATMYEVEGARRRYRLHAERTLPRDHRLDAAVGDLVLVCEYGGRTSERYPPAWSDVERSGEAFRIGRPPAIVRKGKWDPLHISETDLFWAIQRVKWSEHYGDRFVLIHVKVHADLGGDRWEIGGSQKESWVLEVAPSVKGRELLQPDHYVWVIAGHQRFDATLHKLVLVAEDIEERYYE